MKTIKRKIFYFLRKHYKIYTIAILIAGIAIGCMYEGQGDTGERYFNVLGHTFYMGWVQ